MDCCDSLSAFTTIKFDKSGLRSALRLGSITEFEGKFYQTSQDPFTAQEILYRCDNSNLVGIVQPRGAATAFLFVDASKTMGQSWQLAPPQKSAAGDVLVDYSAEITAVGLPQTSFGMTYSTMEVRETTRTRFVTGTDTSSTESETLKYYAKDIGLIRAERPAFGEVIEIAYEK